MTLIAGKILWYIFTTFKFAIGYLLHKLADIRLTALNSLLEMDNLAHSAHGVHPKANEDLQMRLLSLFLIYSGEDCWECYGGTNLAICFGIMSHLDYALPYLGMLPQCQSI